MNDDSSISIYISTAEKRGKASHDIIIAGFFLYFSKLVK